MIIALEENGTLTHLCATWPTSAEEEAYWQSIRNQYMIAPDEIYLNTGSFGSQPRPVLEKMMEILEDVERSPSRHRGKYHGAVDDARARLGSFINAPAEDIAFASNVTMAINMAVHGLDWRPGDEILASDQEYGAIDNCLHLAERRRGVVVKRAQIPVSPERPEDILNAF